MPRSPSQVEELKPQRPSGILAEPLPDGLFLVWRVGPIENYGRAITEASISGIVQAAINLDIFQAIDA